MGGHTGSSVYAHLKKDSQKKRKELQEEYASLNEEEQETYKSLAVIANIESKDPAHKKLRMNTIFDKLHSLIDEAHNIYGVSCSLFTKHVEDTDVTKTTFCNNNHATHNKRCKRVTSRLQSKLTQRIIGFCSFQHRGCCKEL